VERKVLMMVTPRVLEEVRNHFDCPDLEGAELEDQGEEGTLLTHWEKRVFEVSILTLWFRRYSKARYQPGNCCCKNSIYHWCQIK